MSQHGYMAYLPTVQFAGGITSATQIRNAWTNGDKAAHAQIAKTLYPRNPQRAIQLLTTAMNEGVSEDSHKGRDIKRIPIIQKARIAHPMAKNDEEALALFIADREEADVNRLDKEQHREIDMINKIDSVEHDLEHKIATINQELATLKQKLKVRNEDASGVIATKSQAKDPRYSMSLTKDVHPGQIEKNLKAFNL